MAAVHPAARVARVRAGIDTLLQRLKPLMALSLQARDGLLAGRTAIDVGAPCRPGTATSARLPPRRMAISRDMSSQTFALQTAVADPGLVASGDLSHKSVPLPSC